MKQWREPRTWPKYSLAERFEFRKRGAAASKARLQVMGVMRLSEPAPGRRTQKSLQRS